MCKHDAETIAKFVWNLLDLYPEETMGHEFYDRDMFTKKLMEVV